MKFEKNKLILIVISLTIGLILGNLIAFLFIKDFLILGKKEIKPEDINNLFKEFSGSPTVSGYFIDIEDNLLFIETYNSDQSQSAILAIEITKQTTFLEKNLETEDYLVFEDYSEILNSSSKGTILTIYLEDPTEINPKAFVVEIENELSFFHQSIILDPL